jgi:hydrogenase maturation factor HypE
LFDKLGVSIRATLIVSDEEGYNLVRHLISGINYNGAICGIILIKDGTEGDLEDKVKEF